MKKVYILTLVGEHYNDNYGAILQAYALENTLKNLKYRVEIINFTPKSSSSYGLIDSLIIELKNKNLHKALFYKILHNSQKKEDKGYEKEFSCHKKSSGSAGYFSTKALQVSAQNEPPGGGRQDFGA
jgi:hypothetical protein